MTKARRKPRLTLLLTETFVNFIQACGYKQGAAQTRIAASND